MRWTWVFLVLAGCGDTHGQPTDAAIDSFPIDAAIDGSDPNMPATLALTGLCADDSCTAINADIYPYKPRWELWSDSATKKRWIYLPPGTQINTADMDHWIFPMGTKLWKEFTRDGIRVETRMEFKVGPGDTQQDWFYAAYVWNQAQNATYWAEDGEQNANGTQHDVPSKTLCRTCHENNKPQRVIGFSAIQLDEDGSLGDIDLADAIGKGWLSVPPPAPSSGPYFPFVPDAPSAREPLALGYLHANCGHCHNPNSSVASLTGVRLQLNTATLGTLASTPPYQTAVNHTTTNTVNGDTYIVKPQYPGESVLMDRFEAVSMPNLHMPAAGTEDLDTNADSMLIDWVSNIPP